MCTQILMLLSVERLLSIYKEKNLYMLSIYFSSVAKKNVTSLKPRKEIHLDLCFYFEMINSSPL